MFMSTKEASRLRVLTLLETGTISQKEAGQRMDVSPRQVRRMMKRYKVEGMCVDCVAEWSWNTQQCSAVEAKQLVQPDELIEHYKDSVG